LTFPTPGRDFVRHAGLSGITRQIIVEFPAFLGRQLPRPLISFVACGCPWRSSRCSPGSIGDSHHGCGVLPSFGCVPHLGGMPLRHTVPFARKVAQVRLHRGG